jgi:hypothetical protein
MGVEVVRGSRVVLDLPRLPRARARDLIDPTEVHLAVVDVARAEHEAPIGLGVGDGDPIVLARDERSGKIGGLAKLIRSAEFEDVEAVVAAGEARVEEVGVAEIRLEAPQHDGLTGYEVDDNLRPFPG